MTEVYCKKEFIEDPTFTRLQTYYIDQCDYVKGCAVFVCHDKEKTKGRWMNFEEYFTFDKKMILREKKLERICKYVNYLVLYQIELRLIYIITIF